MKGCMDRDVFEPLVKLALIGLVLIVALPLAPAAAFAGSSAAEIKNCADANWCSYHRTVDTAWRHSPLTQVNPSNVKKLRPAWIFQPGDPLMGMHTTPLVVDGFMYVSTNPSIVWKLNAATGDAPVRCTAMWHASHPIAANTAAPR